MKVCVQILTPVHIGTGESLKRGLDVVDYQGKTYIIEWRELMSRMGQQSMQQISAELTKGQLQQSTIQQLIKAYGNTNAIRQIQGKIYGSDFFPHIKLPDVRPHIPGSSIKEAIRTSLIPYLPGSSIKGAIRTVLMWKLMQMNNSLLRWQVGSRQTRKNFEQAIRRKVEHQWRFDSRKKDISSVIVGEFERALTRHLRIPDMIFRSTEWWNAKVCGVNRNGVLQWKNGIRNAYSYKFTPHQFTTGVECLPRDAQAEACWGVELGNPLWDNWWQSFKKKQGEKGGKQGSTDKEENEIRVALFREEWQKLFAGVKNARDFWRKVFTYCNEWMTEYLKREIEFFDKYGKKSAQHIGKMLSKLKSLQQKLENCKQSKGNACLLRIGWGSGFHAMSGDWQYADHIEPLEHTGNVKLKTRKVAFREIRANGNQDFEFSLFGFIKVELI